MDLILAVGIIIGGLAWAFYPRRSRRVPENVIRFVPNSDPVKAEVRANGEVIQFKKEKR